MAGELADQLHKPIKRNFPKRRVIAHHVDDIWCSDLVDMQKLSKWNKGYKYLLMVLDIFSEYGWIIPFKTETGLEVSKVLQIIFKENKTKCVVYIVFLQKNLLEKHKGDCFLIKGTQAITMPAEGSKIYFKNQHKMQRVPFVIYADFDAITEKIDTCQNPDSKSCRTTYQSHRARGFGYKVVCHYDQSYSKPVDIYCGEDASERFIEKMLEEVRSCQSVMRENFNKPLKMTSDEEREF